MQLSIGDINYFFTLSVYFYEGFSEFLVAKNIETLTLFVCMQTSSNHCRFCFLYSAITSSKNTVLQIKPVFFENAI
jgi:hypothetical protein